MATAKQRRAVNIMAENGGVVSKAMLEAGYSPMTAQDPKKLTESIGFKEICEEHGLTDGLILKSLVFDIKKKPKNRKPELELAAKIKGMLKEENKPEGNTVYQFNWYAGPDNNNTVHSKSVELTVPQDQK